MSVLLSSTTDGMEYSCDRIRATIEYSPSHTFTSTCRRYEQMNTRNNHVGEGHRSRLKVPKHKNASVSNSLTLRVALLGLFRAREHYLPIHDSDLRRSAIKKCVIKILCVFTTSPHCMLGFKRLHHIASRKVTTLVIKTHLEDRDQILKPSESFAVTVASMIPHSH